MSKFSSEKFLKRDTKDKDGLGELIRTFIYAVLIAVGIRSLAYEPFNIPSESMLPTLLVGDFVFVSKLTYGYSRFSFPFGKVPLPKDRLFGDMPERGDVAVFRLPSNTKINYIKRILGLPGDRIQIKGGILYINGVAVNRERLGEFSHTNRYGQTVRTPEFRETLPSGKSYLTLDISPNTINDNTKLFVVPPGHYFAMGDNRDNSTDSRVSARDGGVGFLPAENLVGRADIIWYSTASAKPFYIIWDVLLKTRVERFLRLIE